MPSATFPKHERLRGRDVLQAVVKKGKAVNESPFRLVGLITELDNAVTAQVAFAVPKRHVKLATTRNRIRRLMREAYRLDKAAWQLELDARELQCAWLFVYQGRTPVTLQETRTKCSRAFQRWMQQHLPPAAVPRIPS